MSSRTSPRGRTPRLLAAALAIATIATALVLTAGVAAPAVPTPTFVGYPIPSGGGAGPITVGPDGNFWFAENDANKIAKGTTAGVIVEYTVPTAGSQPHGIAVGADNNLWFTEHTGNKIGRITTAGVITEFPIPTAASGPQEITAGPDGNLWFVERTANKIAKITTAGVITEYPVPTAGTAPFSIVAGPDGNLWFTESSGSNIGRITTAGVITEFPTTGGYSTLIIAVGPDGNLWATGGGVINRITTAGVITQFPTQNGDGINYIGTGPDGNLWYSAITGGFRIGAMTPSGDDTQFPFSHGSPGGNVVGPDGNLWIVTSSKLVKARLVPDPTGEFTSLTPARLLDTRPGFPTVDGQAQGLGAVGEGASKDIQISGRGGVPAATEVSAVVLNATVAGPSAASFLTIWPTGLARPTISNLNYLPGQVVPNLVTVALGTGSKVSVYNRFGNAHVIFDVVGYYSTGDGPLGSRFHGVTPFRFFDTRNGAGGVPAAKLGPGGTLKFKVTGKGGVPASGVTAVVINVTVTEPDTASFLTVYPDDVARPNASNLNYVPGLTVPNLVEVRVPASGIVDFYNHNGATHLLADVVGYYDGDKSTEAGRFVPVDPFRRLDTRVSSPFPGGKIPQDNGVIIRYPGLLGIPSTGVGSMVTNVTVTEPDTSSFVTAFPADGQLPLASNLNFVPGQTVPNLVIVRVSTGPLPNGLTTPGWIGYYNRFGNIHLVIDVFGYFTDPSVQPVGVEAADESEWETTGVGFG